MLNMPLIKQPSHSPARDSPVRFLMLLLVVMVVFVGVYSFNNPQALEESLREILNISQTQFQYLYSLYALPNIFTLIAVGYVVDLIGTRKSIIGLSVGIAITQLIVAIAVQAKDYNMLLVGRLLFGIAAEGIFIPAANIISFWFQGKQQAFALGIAITFPELGNALNSLITPLLFEATGSLSIPFFCSFVLCIVGLTCSVVVAYLDRRADKIDSRHNIRLSEPMLQSSIYSMASSQESQQLRCSDIKFIPAQYWLLVSICTCSMCLYIPFLDNVNSLFQKRFCFTQTSAGEAIMIAYLASAMCSIPLGLFVDRFGHRRHFIIAGMTVMLMAQLIILVFPQCVNGHEQAGAISGLFFIGLGYAFYANCMVASIPIIVRKKLLGTAFALMEMFQCFFQFLIPIITGFMVENAITPEKGYLHSSMLFVSIGSIGVCICLGLFFKMTAQVKCILDQGSKHHKYVASFVDLSMQTVLSSERDVSICSFTDKEDTPTKINRGGFNFAFQFQA